MNYSFIIPIYNRPDELQELLESFTTQKGTNLSYEIIVVEDGSTHTSASVIQEFEGVLPLRYIVQENMGPGGARNTGAKQALGEFLVFLDSDTVLPNSYLQAIEWEAQSNPADLWGGPDRAREDFSVIQKAIDYSMTSFLTTGGIRGSKRSVDTFYPRTFNMGIRKSAFEKVQGFRPGMRYGEDLDLSMRAIAAGYRSALYEGAWLYHKRRVSYKQFFNQIRNSGRARIVLNKYHPGTLKWMHTLPALFVVFNFIALVTPHSGLFTILILYMLLIVLDVFIKEGSMEVALNAVAATYVQHFGYGIGFIEELINNTSSKEKH